MVQVHVGHVVKELIAFYQPVLDLKLEFDSIFHQVEAFGLHAYKLFQEGDHRSIAEFNNYNPKYIGKKIEEIIKSNPSKEDFLETAAYNFSFKGYEHLKVEGNLPIDTSFEQAVDLLLSGNKDALIQLIDSDPTLLHRNSRYNHKAGLIHYLGSNGVEFWRQVVPLNIVELLRLLLERGVDPDMPNNIYGSSSTLAGLIQTSAHPHKAGLTPDLINLLSEFT